MTMHDSAVHSGNDMGPAPDRHVVALRYGGHRVGLYRVKQVGEAGMLLNHGGISFPVGTQLDVEDFSCPVRDARAPTLRAVVVDNTPMGLRLVWRSQAAGEQ